MFGLQIWSSVGGDGAMHLTQYQYILASLKVKETIDNEVFEEKEAAINMFLQGGRETKDKEGE